MIPFLAQPLDPELITISTLADAATWADIYAQTTNPLIVGQPWNDGSYLRFSSGPLWDDLLNWNDTETWTD